MKKIAISLAAASVIAVASAVVITGGEPEMKPTTMLSRLKVGQQVRLVTTNPIGFNIEIPNAHYIENFERSNQNRKYVTSKITEIGSDFIVVSSANSGEKTIALHAIAVITTLPEVKAEADDEPKK